MKFKAEFSVDNASFDDDLNFSVSNVLKSIIKDLSMGKRCTYIKDVNGNTIGVFGFYK